MQVVLQIVILDENGFAASLLSTICEMKGRKAKINAGLPEVEEKTCEERLKNPI